MDPEHERVLHLSGTIRATRILIANMKLYHGGSVHVHNGKTKEHTHLSMLGMADLNVGSICCLCFYALFAKRAEAQSTLATLNCNTILGRIVVPVKDPLP
ncbi:hypothetical protein CBL_03178 [Carabus blaptoides fortunei]